MTLDSWLAQRNPELRVSPAKKVKLDVCGVHSIDASRNDSTNNDVGDVSSNRGDDMNIRDEVSNRRFNCESDASGLQNVIMRSVPVSDTADLRLSSAIESAVTLVPAQTRIAPSYNRIAAPPPKFRLSSLTSLYDVPPEVRIGTHALSEWVSSAHFDFQKPLTCVQCLPTSPCALITGLGETPSVHLLNCTETASDFDNPGLYASSKLPLEWPVTAMTMLASNAVLLGSSRGIAQIDCNAQTQCNNKPTSLNVTSFGLGPTDEISTISARYGTSTVALGTSSGRLQIWDVREKAWTKNWTRTHAITDGPRMNRLNPAVTHVVWSSETVLATASKHNETVKFWDLRARSKEPINVTQARTAAATANASISSRDRYKRAVSGISGLTCDPNNSSHLWAVNTSGDLLKLSDQQAMPEYKLRVQRHTVPKYGQTIAFVDHDQYPLLAIAGSSGTALVTEPSWGAKDRGIDAVQASQLYSPVDITAVQWHPYTKQLVTLSHCGWKWWIPSSNDQFKGQGAAVKKLRVRMQPVRY